MNLSIATEGKGWDAIPDLEELATRAVTAAMPKESEAEVSLLFAGDAQVAELNRRWRGKQGPTNVLSFPAPKGREALGDIVLASGVVAREAGEQSKSFADHTTHLIVHGVLHLLGFDHQSDSEAQEMEAREIIILEELGITNPYLS
ncbi:MAG: rRNA maturation RNase YbeY [Rhizobiales bacterium]|nr:rRNA maturation RNase YbeY [Hyphomicrobiales bacterium]